jgi:DNA-binding beta-propeller fold protein YncE
MKSFVAKYSFLGLALVLTAPACSDANTTESAEEEQPTCEGAGNICTIMGDGRAALGEDGVDPLEGSLYLPQDVTVGPDNELYVLDWNNHRVRTIDEDGLIDTVIGLGELGDASNGVAKEVKLNHPTHVAFSPEGNLVLSAWHNSKVMEMDMSTGRITAVCGTGDRSFGGEGGPAAMAVLDLPVATAFDSDGRMYIMDQGNQRIRRVEEDGVINTVVGPVGAYLPPGFVEVCGEQPEDPNQAPVCKFCLEAEAELPNCAGPPARPQGFAGEGASGTEAFMNQPFSQSAPPAGRMEMGPGDVLYFADSSNHIVRALDPDGTVSTVAGQAPAPYVPTESRMKAPKGDYDNGGGDPLQALLNSPRDVAVGADGSLYIADTENSCVRKVDEDGEISTVAGVCTERGFEGDFGPADEALLDRPYGIAVDSDGNLYIADTYNDRIRVVYAE